MAIDLPAALAEWSTLLGPANLVTDAEARQAAQTATFATTQTLRAILRPASSAEVAACLKIAQRHRVPVHPVSRGRNWGYGSRVPSADGCVLLQLDRLDRILDHDDALGTLTVEPGVTFEAAARFLRERRAQHFLTTIGGPADASLIGNALERGDGRGPHADVFAHVCALEVILPTGERLETGLSRLPHARGRHHHRWGVGPSLDGLFSQSNLGVVTRMTFWLPRRPGAYRDVSFTLGDDAQLGPALEGLQRLIDEGTVRASAFVWNELKALSITRQYPFTETRGRVPLPSIYLDAWRERFGRWAGSTGLYAATPAIAAALESRVREVLEPQVTRLQIAEVAPEADSPMLGTPSTANLAMGYWRKRGPLPQTLDLDRDRCGFLWSSVAVPFRAADCVAALEIAGRVSRMFSFEPNVALLAPTPRCVYLASALIYDRQVRGEDERALAALRALERELGAAGYVAVREGIATASPAGADDSREVLRRLKAVLDPAGVLSPGRYGL